MSAKIETNRTKLTPEQVKMLVDCEAKERKDLKKHANRLRQLTPDEAKALVDSMAGVLENLEDVTDGTTFEYYIIASELEAGLTLVRY